jgi:hypothetical protein
MLVHGVDDLAPRPEAEDRSIAGRSEGVLVVRMARDQIRADEVLGDAAIVAVDQVLCEAAYGEPALGLLDLVGDRLNAIAPTSSVPSILRHGH